MSRFDLIARQDPICFYLLILLEYFAFFSGSRFLRAEKNTRTVSSGRNERLEVESLPLVVLSFSVLVFGYTVLCSHISHLCGTIFLMREGSLLIPGDGTVNERERKKLHCLQNVFIDLQAKPFLADLNSAFFWEYALNYSV